MAIMTRPEATKCLKHGQVCSTFCSWCSKPICDDCIALAGNKKYCDKCNSKKASMQVKTGANIGSVPKEPIKNRDTSLTDEFIQAQRASWTSKKEPNKPRGF